MRNRWRGRLVRWSLAAAGGTVFVTGAEPACISFAADQAQATTDFCFLFDCQNGAFGGLIDFCSPSSLEEPLFTDCPEFNESDGNP